MDVRAHANERFLLVQDGNPELTVDEVGCYITNCLIEITSHERL